MTKGLAPLFQNCLHHFLASAHNPLCDPALLLAHRNSHLKRKLHTELALQVHKRQRLLGDTCCSGERIGRRVQARGVRDMMTRRSAC